MLPATMMCLSAVAYMAEEGSEMAAAVLLTPYHQVSVVGHEEGAKVGITSGRGDGVVDGSIMLVRRSGKRMNIITIMAVVSILLYNNRSSGTV